MITPSRSITIGCTNPYCLMLSATLLICLLSCFFALAAYGTISASRRFVISMLSSCFVTSPHPLALHSRLYPPRRAYTSCVSGSPQVKHGTQDLFYRFPAALRLPTSHQELGNYTSRLILSFLRFLARWPGWYGIAVLPCFSASGKVPVTRCGLPLRGTYAAYWPSSRLDCHTLMPA